jgi:MoxR-like ATPase
MTAGYLRELRDRVVERETLDHVLLKARNGQGTVLVIRGEPGVGKSELLRYLAD